ncbi:MAG: protein arginine kinase [Candidatus Latescibacteria bacterium]|nr:protein arginine kinase [Candidatus Latescibacterota bacterium]
MNFESIVHTIPMWLDPTGPESDIVISSRARLARNIKGIPYAHRASEEKLKDVVSNVLDAAESAGYDPANFFKNEDLDDFRKNVFIERHLISPALAQKRGNRGVLVKNMERDSILINEEDHLRLQSIYSGFDLMNAWENVDGIDDNLSKGIKFSFSGKYGYLTACPTNFGTGLRASILIHLPALVLTKEIQRVIRSVGQLGLVVRGYRGEGSDVVGNLFQISNQTSLGKTEREIVSNLSSVVNQIINYEKKAKDMLLKEAKQQTEDKIWRSLGILKAARVLSTHEFMNLNSAVRFGYSLNLLDKPYLKTLNELMVLVQPGHLQATSGKQMEPIERDILRADIVRQRFIDVKI